MDEITLREYRLCDLRGGTLIVSVPQAGLANVLLTDHVLENHGMDHLAALDSDDFPPIAMVRRGKARFPYRIHADETSKLAILRSEFPMAPELARPVARALLGWTNDHKLSEVVVLDQVVAASFGAKNDGAPPVPPEVRAVASLENGRRRARAAGIKELDDAVLGGLLAVLVLEARFADVDLVGLVSIVGSPFEEGESLLALAAALAKLVPATKLDLARLRSQSTELRATLAALKAEAERTIRLIQGPRTPTEPAPIYG